MLFLRACPHCHGDLALRDEVLDLLARESTAESQLPRILPDSELSQSPAGLPEAIDLPEGDIADLAPTIRLLLGLPPDPTMIGRPLVAA